MINIPDATQSLWFVQVTLSLFGVHTCFLISSAAAA